MYDKRWVIENILAVGRHFQSTSYVNEDGIKARAYIFLFALHPLLAKI